MNFLDVELVDDGLGTAGKMENDGPGATRWYGSNSRTAITAG